MRVISFKKQDSRLLPGKEASFRALTFLKVLIVNDSLKNDVPASLRITPAYAEATRLLRRKKALQAGLRDVDRMLRELELAATGVISVARYDMDHASAGSPSACLTCPR